MENPAFATACKHRFNIAFRCSICCGFAVQLARKLFRFVPDLIVVQPVLPLIDSRPDAAEFILNRLISEKSFLYHF